AGPRPSLDDEDRVADADLVEQLDHVGDRHPDAAVRAGGAERARLFGAVDARAVRDAHPARLDGVLRPGRDRLPGELPGPGAVRHVPGRVDLLVLDAVATCRRLETLHADGDLVA